MIEKIINSDTLPRGSRVYYSGNIATPVELFEQIIADESITGIEMMGCLPLDERIAEIYSEKTSERIHHTVLFCGHLTRKGVQGNWIDVIPTHLSHVPKVLEDYQPNVVLIAVSPPDEDGYHSYGVTAESMRDAIEITKENGGIVIAEVNHKIPYTYGSKIHASEIDKTYETTRDLPALPKFEMNETAKRIGELIAGLFINNGSTLQYGIGDIPQGVTQGIIERGLTDLGIHSEVFTIEAFRPLIEAGIVNNLYRNGKSSTTIFLGSGQDSYDWLHKNEDIELKHISELNNYEAIQCQPDMVSINTAMGIAINGVWADSNGYDKYYSGKGGQCDFLRAADTAVIALASTYMKNREKRSKVVFELPPQVSPTANDCDRVVYVTEQGAFDARSRTMAERALGIARLADPDFRDELVQRVYETWPILKRDYATWEAARDNPLKGFTRYGHHRNPLNR